MARTLSSHKPFHNKFVSLFLVMHAVLGCGSGDGPINQRAGRPSAEQVNEILASRYAESENFDQQVSAVGGRIRLSLDFSYTKLNDEDFEKIKLPEYLTDLSLAGTEITDAGIEYLKNADHLQELDLSHTKITNACIDRLRGLPELRVVRLHDTGISGDQQREMIRFLRSKERENKKNAP